MRSDFVSLLTGLFYPQVCMACGGRTYHEGEMLCSKCLYELPRTFYHLDPENEVFRSFWGRLPVEKASAYYFFNKGSKFQKLLHALKYQGKSEIGEFMGRIMAQDLAADGFLEDIDGLVPVPLHPKKQRIRGYNQSAIIARGITEESEIPLYTDLLYRKVHTSTQTKKSRYHRWENVSSIFGARMDAKVKGAHLLVIDDVITTGATLEASAAPLIKQMDARVSILAMAHA